MRTRTNRECRAVEMHSGGRMKNTPEPQTQRKRVGAPHAVRYFGRLSFGGRRVAH